MSKPAASISDGHPVEGYYKTRKHKAGPWLPVCLWLQDGEMVCRVGPDMADANDTWLFCADNSVPKADALYAFKHGAWPGDAPAVVGDNSPPSDDPFEAISQELAAEEARVKAWVAEPHEGVTKANMASNWLDNLRKLEKRTIAAFDAEKAPALIEATRIAVKWRAAKALAASIKKAMDDCYQAIGRKEKARLQAIADAKAKVEAEERRKAWEAEQAKRVKLAAEHNIPIEAEPTPQLDLPAPAVKAAFGGAQGPKIAVRAIPAVGLVEDWAKAAVHYSAAPKIRELIQRLANADSKNGVIVPGVKIIPGE